MGRLRRATALHALLAAVALLGVLLGACARMNAGTNLTRVTDPAYRGLQFRHVAVFADASDLGERKRMEDAVVLELRRLDIPAQSSIEVLPPTRDYTAAERVRVLIAANLEGIVLISGEKGIQSIYVPVAETKTTTTGTVTVQGNTADYRETARTDHQGGYTIEKPWSKITTRLVDLDGGQTAWVAFAETRGSGFATFADLTKSYARSIAKQISEDHILATQRELDDERRRLPTQVDALQTSSRSSNASTVAEKATLPPALPPATARKPAATSDFNVMRLEGCVLAGEDGQFLGRITVNASDPDSLINVAGRSGSKTSKTSIFNTSSNYGDARDAMSAFNPGATSPPSIFCGDHFEAFLTTNREKAPAIDPRLLSAILRSAVLCTKDIDCGGDLVCVQRKCSRP